MYRFFLLSISLLFVHECVAAIPPPLGGQLDEAVGNKEATRDLVAAFISESSVEFYGDNNPLLVRAYSMEGLEKPGHIVHPAVQRLDPLKRTELALVLDDIYLAQQLEARLPRLAAAYRITRRSDFLERITAQLDEVVAWQPLQRKGWQSLEQTDYVPLSTWKSAWGAGEGDAGAVGPWYATALTIRAVADTLELLHKGVLPADLNIKIEAFLKSERDALLEVLNEDAEGNPPRIVSDKAFSSLEWIMLNEALVRATVALGRDNDEALRLGSGNLMKALFMLGTTGEWAEGTLRAQTALPSLCSAARTLRNAGDKRMLIHRYLYNSAVWYARHRQPGLGWVNAGDAPGMHPMPRDDAASLELLAELYWLTESPFALWALEDVFSDAPASLWGILASYREGSSRNGAAPPPTNAASYRKNARVLWRDSWHDDATSVTILGRAQNSVSPQDESGQVTYYAYGRPILVEGGNPPLHEPLGLLTRREHALYASSAHNVISSRHMLDDGGSIPILIRRNNLNGGQTSMNLAAAYPGLSSWMRNVNWDTDSLRVVDDATTTNAQLKPFELNWHLGATELVDIEQLGPLFWKVEWNYASITIKAPAPISVTQEIFPGFSLVSAGSPEAPQGHVVLRVRSVHLVQRFRVETEITPK